MKLHTIGALALVLAVAGCSEAGSGSDGDIRTYHAAMMLDEAAQFSLQVPSSVSVASTAIGASEWLKWDDRAKMVADGNDGVIHTSGLGGLEVGHDATPRSVVAFGSATVRDRAKIDGNLVVQGQAQLGSSVQVFGSQVLGATVELDEGFTVPVFIPDDWGGDVHLEPDQQETLSPALYGTVAVKSRATLKLNTGTYQFGALHAAEPQSKLLIDDSAGPVIIYVRDQLTYRGQVESVSGGFPNLLIVYLGASDLWLEAPYQGHLFAPHAVARIRPMQGPYTGSVWAKGVEVHPGTVFVHHGFDPQVFFPSDVPDVDDTPYVLGQTDPVEPGPDDFLLPVSVAEQGTGGGSSVGDEPDSGWVELPAGTPEGLDCVSNLVPVLQDGDPSQPLDGLRYMTAAEQAAAESVGCVHEYRECPVAADGTVGAPVIPSEDALNAEPAPGSTCEEVTSADPCGVDDAVLDLPEAERRTCVIESDCLTGEVCAGYCLQDDKDCQADEFVNYCTTVVESCEGLPATDECEVRDVCPDDDYTGAPYVPAPNQGDIPADQKVFSEALPTLAGFQRPVCGSSAPAPIGSTDNSEPAEDSGNDKWGIDFSPVVDYSFMTPSSATAISPDLSVGGRAEFRINAKVWGKHVPVFSAGVAGSLGPSQLEVTSGTKLFGQQIDLTGDVVGSIPTDLDLIPAALAAQGLRDVEERMERAQQSFADLLMMRDVLASNDIVGDADLGNELCELAKNVTEVDFTVFGENELFNPCEPDPQCLAVTCTGSLDFLCTCDVEETAAQAAARFAQVVDRSMAAWQEAYASELAALGDPEAAVDGALAPILSQLPGNNPDLATDIPLEAARHRFSAFRYSFTFPVGPIPVTMEIELAGSWGVDAQLELDSDLQDELFARAGAAVVPGMDVQALAFAGISLGFASVGIGGELTLIEIEIPVRGGAEVIGEQLDDTRPLQLALPDGGNQDLSEFADDVLPLLTTRWSGGFYYGAGMRVGMLSGNVNLQARIRLLFYKKTFKKILAKWNGITFDHSFVGSIQAVDGLELPAEAQSIADDLAAAGADPASLVALVPLSDKGYTGHFGPQIPLLAQDALAGLEWPPTYDPALPTVPMPSVQSMCGLPDEEIVR